MQLMSIRDVTTNKVFEIDPSKNTVWVTTRDGVRVRLHPVTLKTMVKRGQEFDGFTLVGTRKMVRI